MTRQEEAEAKRQRRAYRRKPGAFSRYGVTNAGPEAARRRAEERRLARSVRGQARLFPNPPPKPRTNLFGYLLGGSAR